LLRDCWQPINEDTAMKGKITKRTVDAIESGEKDVFLWDADLKGFALKVTHDLALY
jgi:hypothetical protein